MTNLISKAKLVIQSPKLITVWMDRDFPSEHTYTELTKGQDLPVHFIAYPNGGGVHHRWLHRGKFHHPLGGPAWVDDTPTEINEKYHTKDPLYPHGLYIKYQKRSLYKEWLPEDHPDAIQNKSAWDTYFSMRWDQKNPVVVWDEELESSKRPADCQHDLFTKSSVVQNLDSIGRRIPSYDEDHFVHINDHGVYEQTEMNGSGTVQVRRFVSKRVTTFHGVRTFEADRDDGPAIIRQYNVLELIRNGLSNFIRSDPNYEFEWYTRGNPVPNKDVNDYFHQNGFVLGEGPCVDRPMLMTGQDRMCFITEVLKQYH